MKESRPFDPLEPLSEEEMGQFRKDTDQTREVAQMQETLATVSFQIDILGIDEALRRLGKKRTEYGDADDAAIKQALLEECSQEMLRDASAQEQWTRTFGEA